MIRYTVAPLFGTDSLFIILFGDDGMAQDKNGYAIRIKYIDFARRYMADIFDAKGTRVETMFHTELSEVALMATDYLEGIGK